MIMAWKGIFMTKHAISFQKYGIMGWTRKISAMVTCNICVKTYVNYNTWKIQQIFLKLSCGSGSVMNSSVT